MLTLPPFSNSVAMQEEEHLAFVEEIEAWQLAAEESATYLATLPGPSGIEPLTLTAVSSGVADLAVPLLVSYDWGWGRGSWNRWRHGTWLRLSACPTWSPS